MSGGGVAGILLILLLVVAIVYRSIVCENCTAGQCLRGRESWKIQGHLGNRSSF